MNIKALLLGSAAALAVVSGAQAADAIVAAEPEPIEYVRVCDAYGTGYFYIPGTETCLLINGYVRFQTDFGHEVGSTFDSGRHGSDWDAFTRAQLQFTTKSDTEYGTLTGLIALRTNADSPNADGDKGSGRNTFIDVAYIDIAGFRVGYQYSWWDDDMSGETDVLNSNSTNHNSIRYQYTADNFTAGVAVDELQGNRTPFGSAARAEDGQSIGVAGQVSVTFSPVTAYLLGGYDTDTENGAIRGIVYAEIGPGKLGLAGVWASGSNAYYEASEWAVAVQYAVKATDKFTITPGFQYFGNYGLVAGEDEFNDDNDAWKAGLTLDYQIAENLSSKVSVQYFDQDEGDEQWTGFFRLQRAF
ncbi:MULTISPECIES: porin [unclassified Sinorhizobium]|uniref:porin n=1 Tax=unclassified Sinorhizobium TaxID=2613772 RepID=UPI0035244B43